MAAYDIPTSISRNDAFTSLWKLFVLDLTPGLHIPSAVVLLSTEVEGALSV